MSGPARPTSGASPASLAVWTAFAVVPFVAFAVWVSAPDGSGSAGWAGPAVVAKLAPMIVVLWRAGAAALVSNRRGLLSAVAWTIAMADLATLFALLSEPCELCSDRPEPAFPWATMLLFLPLVWVGGLAAIGADARRDRGGRLGLACERCGANGLREGQPYPLCGERVTAGGGGAA